MVLKKKIYERAKLTLAEFFVDSKNTVRYENIENSTLIHNGMNKSRANLDFYFSLKIETKNNKYRMSLYNLRLGYLTTKSPIIDIFNTIITKKAVNLEKRISKEKINLCIMLNSLRIVLSIQ